MSFLADILNDFSVYPLLFIAFPTACLYNRLITQKERYVHFRRFQIISWDNRPWRTHVRCLPDSRRRFTDSPLYDAPCVEQTSGDRSGIIETGAWTRKQCGSNAEFPISWQQTETVRVPGIKKREKGWKDGLFPVSTISYSFLPFRCILSRKLILLFVSLFELKSPVFLHTFCVIHSICYAEKEQEPSLTKVCVPAFTHTMADKSATDKDMITVITQE